MIAHNLSKENKFTYKFYNLARFSKYSIVDFKFSFSPDGLLVKKLADFNSSFVISLRDLFVILVDECCELILDILLMPGHNAS